MKWRWDQGRLDYFQLEEIQHIARALAVFDGQPLPRGNDTDTLREVLEQFSERPFSPTSYKVWRNYKRVFGCEMLAVEINGLLICTELCKSVANLSISHDDYLLHVATHFNYPSPVFDHYNVDDDRVFPFCATIKFLVSEFLTKSKPLVTLVEIADYLLGNKVSGFESVASLSNLSPSNASMSDKSDELRQLREMIRFISQFSFLKWDNPNLYLDVTTVDEAQAMAALMQPKIVPMSANSAQEILNIGRAPSSHFSTLDARASSENVFDIEFVEGNRVRKTHLRIERSSKLREIYFAQTHSPSVCHMCDLDTLDKYPWATRLIEMHHLLPLASPIGVEKRSTSLRDIVGLCPTCHRATHKYYSQWLSNNNTSDFRGRDEARHVYELAKGYLDT